MASVDVPLTLHTALTSWRADPTTLVLAILAAGTYWLSWRRSSLPVSRLVVFGAACVVWLISGCGFVGVYGDTLFWVRALQFVMILFLAPLLLALAMPVTALRDASSPRWRARGRRMMASRVARMLAHPATTSAAMLVMPWLIYLTAWYPALLADRVVDDVTRILLLLIGCGYFYVRLQLDPVPHRRPQSVSLLISLVETLGDGVLGVVIWQGAILAPDHYAALHRTWGPSIRTDQTIGAGVFWILGDLVGLPFLMLVLGRFRADERVREIEVDAVLDGTVPGRTVLYGEPPDAPTSDSGLWWEHDPAFRNRR